MYVFNRVFPNDQTFSDRAPNEIYVVSTCEGGPSKISDFYLNICFLYFSSMSETATVKKIFVALFISLISKTHSPWTLHWWIGVDQLTWRGPVGVRENILSIRLSIIIHCVWGRGREGIETWGKSNCGSTSDQSRNHSWDLEIEMEPRYSFR